MKNLVFVLLLGLSLPLFSGAVVYNGEVPSVVVFHDGDKEPNVLSFKVEKVIGSEKEAKKLKASIMKVKGVKDVSICTRSGTVKVSYTDELKSKDEILASVEKAGYKYDLKAGCCSKEGGKKACPSTKSSCEHGSKVQ